MKDFEDFMKTFPAKEISQKITNNLISDNSKQFNQHDMDLIQSISQTVGISVIEILRYYHDWSQK